MAAYTNPLLSPAPDVAGPALLPRLENESFLTEAHLFL